MWAWTGEGESRFREGDLLALHAGDPVEHLLGRGFMLDQEDEGRWLLRGRKVDALFDAHDGGAAFADPDGIDLGDYYRKAIEEIGSSEIGREIVLPLLGGTLEISFVPDEVTRAAAIARERGFNERQAEAVGLAYGAEQLACIQGPPGTGKSSVLALAARLMAERGERVLLSSHTHMAINNALNKIHREGVPVAKIGAATQRKGLDPEVPCRDTFAAWDERPGRGGYVIGATPFATCGPRLEGCEFDTVLFDEASQVTVPLALMAMRKCRRYVFVGDQRQLPPVTLSRSVLDPGPGSAFALLADRGGDHQVMLEETYRMNRWLTQWPSDAYYGGGLVAAGPNRERRLALDAVPGRLGALLDPACPGVFVPTLDRSARTRNLRDAELVKDLCVAAMAGGLAPQEIGIVAPFRAQGRAIRTALARTLGAPAAALIVADTVERMQGQERELVILSLATGDEVCLAAMAEFFFQPQRLNVSITRAKAKLIVIGPVLEHALEVEHREVGQWIEQYRRFIGQLQRVEL